MLDEKLEKRLAKNVVRTVKKEKIAPRKGTDLVTVSDTLPANLPLVPTPHSTLFPGMVIPLILPEGKLTKTIEFVMKGQGVLGIVLPKESKKGEEDLPFHTYGVAAKILKKVNLPDNQISVLVTGVERFRIKSVISESPYQIAAVEYLYEETEKNIEVEALLRTSLQQFKTISKDNPLISEEVKVALVNIDGPGKLADFMASVLVRDVKDYQDFLSLKKVKSRLQTLLILLKKELDVQSVQKKIVEEVNQRIGSAQREFYLQEQLKEIQKELGRGDAHRKKIQDKFKERLKEKVLTKGVQERLDEEFEKVSNLHEQSAEYSVAINYLDWATSLPWGIRTQDNLNLKHAQSVLDKDHHGLKDVKERILEFLAVQKLKANNQGSILCLVGPPGTGKTSLGKSIARTLGRKFFRVSVGGMRDESEIKGHRRTYVGSMPGKIIQGLKRVGTQNPVFLIDEIDKMGHYSHHGDPASSMLELLDPEQNQEFMDNYLDLPFDCSEIFFITTANSLDSIPGPLLDRMEVIFLHGYTDHEKIQIAKQYLIPKQLRKNAISREYFKMTDQALKLLIELYAREAGVRNLEKKIARICRKIALKVALGKTQQVVISDEKSLEKYLGVPIFSPETEPDRTTSGVATGLAWTSFGGEVLYIESRSVLGRAGFTLTGQLGDVMQESATIAYTFMRDFIQKKAKLDKNFFDKRSFHLHVPSGATPKDGPSAGVTMAASLYSLIMDKPLNPEVAMTGELSLTGKVLPVGGIKEKLLAAKRSHLKTVLIPKANEKNLREIEKDVMKGLKIVKISKFQDCLPYLLVK
mgnify:CR=1 FL=1